MHSGQVASFRSFLKAHVCRHRLRIKAAFRWIYAAFAVLSVTACGGPAELEDLSGSADYKAVIGDKYEIIGSLTINGIIDLSEKDDMIDWYSIFPSPGILGAEVVSSMELPKQTNFAIKRVLRRKTIASKTIVLEVQLDGVVLRSPSPVYISLYGGNEGSGALLNGKLFLRKS